MLYSAFILGLAGSLHCMVMCGPLAMLLQAKTNGKWSNNFLYHLGRISIYFLLGVFFGLVGRALNLVANQSLIFIIIGSLFLLYLLFPKKIKNKVFLVTPLNSQIQRIRKWIGKTLESKSPFTSLFFGMLNGLIPCGLVYFALLAALAMPSVSTAAIYMLYFGLGTVPLLLFAAPIGSFFKTQFGHHIQFKQSYAIAILGILFVFRGLGLGIPFLSPKVEFSPTKTEITDCK